MSMTIKGARLLVARGAARLLKSRNYSDEMKLTLAGANKVFYDNVEVRQIDVPSFSGSFGILAKHVPVLAVLRPGVVQVFEKDGNVKKVFVSSGSITVNEDSTVQVLAEEACDVEELDSQEARKLLSDWQSKLSSAGSDKEKAEAAIAVECAEALVKAIE